MAVTGTAFPSLCFSAHSLMISRAQYPHLLQDARDSMRNLMWHRNQKALSDFVIAILDEPRT